MHRYYCTVVVFAFALFILPILAAAPKSSVKSAILRNDSKVLPSNEAATKTEAKVRAAAPRKRQGVVKTKPADGVKAAQPKDDQPLEVVPPKALPSLDEVKISQAQGNGEATNGRVNRLETEPQHVSTTPNTSRGSISNVVGKASASKSLKNKNDTVKSSLDTTSRRRKTSPDAATNISISQKRSKADLVEKTPVLPTTTTLQSTTSTSTTTVSEMGDSPLQFEAIEEKKPVEPLDNRIEDDTDGVQEVADGNQDAEVRNDANAQPLGFGMDVDNAAVPRRDTARRRLDAAQRRADLRRYEEERRHAEAMRAEEERRLEKFANLERNLSMPGRYPIVPNGENFMIEPGGNYEFPVWHAPYPVPGSTWPLPLQMRQSQSLLRIDAERFRFTLKSKTNPILRENIERYRRVICEQKAVSVISDFRMAAAFELLAAAGNTALITNLEIRVQRHGEPYPHLYMDESYLLKISAQEVFIQANETWGALRALETFAQLVMRSPDDTLYVNNTFLHDEPRFRYRGVMMDTARHYMAKETLLRNLDAMAINKLNVFHWHMVDDSSFPFQSRVWPQLSAKGAYDPLSMVYTYEDVKEIVEYARFRGIRVIPEFDTPGHTHSWGRGYPELLTPCYSMHYSADAADTEDQKELKRDEPEKPGIYRTQYGTLVFDGHFGPLNPAKNFTYEFLEKLFEEVLSLFPDEYLHLGADETGYSCWLSNPYVKAKISAAVRNSKAIYAYYLIRVHQLLRSISDRRKKPVKTQVWEEVYNEQIKIPEDTTVHVWRSETYMARQVASNGYDVVYSSCWYMDHLKGGPEWPAFYQCDPGFAEAETPYEIRKHFLGGEACMWAEHQDNFAVLSRIWPLASATAERLWSAGEVSDTFLAAPRIEEQRCRMAARGIPVGVASGSGTCIRLTPAHREAYLHNRMALLRELRKAQDFSELLRNANVNMFEAEEEMNVNHNHEQPHIEAAKRRSKTQSADEEFYAVIMKSVLIGVLLGTAIAFVIALIYFIVVFCCMKKSYSEQPGKGTRYRQSSRSSANDSMLLRCGVTSVCRYLVVRKRACFLLFGGALIVYAVCAMRVSQPPMQLLLSDAQPQRTADVEEELAPLTDDGNGAGTDLSTNDDDDARFRNGYDKQDTHSAYQTESYRFAKDVGATNDNTDAMQPRQEPSDPAVEANAA